MIEEKINILTECLFTLVDSLNTVVDRLDTLAEKQEELLLKNEAIFKLAREDFFRRIIEAEVDKEMERSKQKNEFSKQHSSKGESGKKIAFNITSRS